MLENDEWTSHHVPQEPIGSMITGTARVLSDSVFCTGPGALDPFGASQPWEKKAEAGEKKYHLEEKKRHCRSVNGH